MEMYCGGVVKEVGGGGGEGGCGKGGVRKRLWEVTANNQKQMSSLSRSFPHPHPPLHTPVHTYT